MCQLYLNKAGGRGSYYKHVQMIKRKDGHLLGIDREWKIKQMMILELVNTNCEMIMPLNGFKQCIGDL